MARRSPNRSAVPVGCASKVRVQPDLGMRGYLARLLGHGLAGRVIEHVLGIHYGQGANGKTTLIAAVQAALGDYADAADPELLTFQEAGKHRPGRIRVIRGPGELG